MPQQPHNVARLRHMVRQCQKYSDVLERHKKKGPLFAAAVEQLQGIQERPKPLSQ